MEEGQIGPRAKCRLGSIPLLGVVHRVGDPVDGGVLPWGPVMNEDIRGTPAPGHGLLSFCTESRYHGDGSHIHYV